MMRLDKFLVETQVATRSQAKAIVSKGLVSVNGIVVKNASIKIDEYHDIIFYNNKEIQYQKYFYIMLNKPRGVVSATTDNIHQTVVDLLPNQYKKCFPVGRLDKDTVGLLLLTTDGNLAHNLLSPKKHVDKVYEVHLKNKIENDYTSKFKLGIVLEDGYQCLSANFEKIDEYKGLVTISEGKFHQVKRMFKALNNEVVFLKRIKTGNLILDETLKDGEYRSLTINEIEQLKKSR